MGGVISVLRIFSKSSQIFVLMTEVEHAAAVEAKPEETKTEKAPKEESNGEATETPATNGAGDAPNGEKTSEEKAKDEKSEDVADHYNKIEEKGRDVRRESQIYYMRNFNNWIKS